MKCEIVGRCCEERGARGQMPEVRRYDYHLRLLEPVDDFPFRMHEFITIERTPKPEESTQTADNTGNTQVLCPQCNSDDLMLLVKVREYECMKCNRTWRA